MPQGRRSAAFSGESAVSRRRAARAWVDEGARVAFDAAADAVQIEGGELELGCKDFADAPDREDQRVFARQAGAMLAAQLAAGIACSGRTSSTKPVR
jgi:hypothetical protein